MEEMCTVVKSLSQVADAIAFECPPGRGPAGTVLCVVLRHDGSLDEGMVRHILSELCVAGLKDRLPQRILQVPDIPCQRSGAKAWGAIERCLCGATPADCTDVRNPQSIASIVHLFERGSVGTPLAC
ncbi:MAG: hypothetical protein KGJ30_01820 [Burkholderiales bacterium]|nr:hypothetical protein [Burkholderiales bacterium]MDE1925869.1 hypothetical protein [Burkholderiales bacterium]MDE2157633.1 hypothetical protein [Burkholderiales bacterium]